MNRLSVVLLVGGESRRMGQDKATLIYRDRPLWSTQLNLLHQLEPAELFVSARKDPAWRPADAIFVADVPPSRGPLSGLTATLGCMSGTHLLALAVDMPRMMPAYLRSLWNMVEPGCGVLPVISDRAEPLAAIYPVEALIHFQEALEGDDFSLQRIVRRLVDKKMLRSVPVRPEDMEYFSNLNRMAVRPDVG
jgi:molybdopterin-guanine dinucleotide biosynthesis protein A